MSKPSDETVPRNTALNIAVGMGVPFRFALALILMPIWIVLLILAAIFAPHGNLAKELSCDFPDYWYWIWHGEKKW